VAAVVFKINDSIKAVRKNAGRKLMNVLANVVVVYLVIVNLVTFVLFWHDKKRSKRNGWRVPEKTLLAFCAVGGAPGGILGMHLLHHKTKHLKFSLGVPVILLIQGGLLVIWVIRAGLI
jgi:uncharacterized membrane protein YsdA (DUF1294 family)